MKRQTVEINFPNVGTIKMYVTPTMRETQLADIEVQEQLYGVSRYAETIATISDLQAYQRQKNIEKLSQEVYDTLNTRLIELLKILKTQPEDKQTLDEVSTIVGQMYYDGKTEALTTLNNRLTQAKDLAMYNQLIIRDEVTKDFNVWELSEQEYETFRQAMEDCLRKFRTQEKQST